MKSDRREIPGADTQAARFLKRYTTIERKTQPLQRFRHQPTQADIDRVRRLQGGASDTVRVLCLRVEFQPDTTTLTTGDGKMDTLGFLTPDSGLFYDPPHFKRYFERQMEGLRNYYLGQSLGKLYVQSTIMPADEKTCYQLPRDMTFYGDTVSFDAVEMGLVRLMRDALKVADEDAAIDFADYDEFVVFHAGSGLQADYGLRNDSPFDLLAGEIPSGAIEAYLGEPYISVDSGRTHIEHATVLPEMMRQDTMYNGETNILGMTGLAGTLYHEFAHLLGAYDLYDVTGVTMGVGEWSLMGYGGWLGDYGAGAPPGVVPGFLDAYSRAALGLVNPLEVRTPRESIPVYAAEMDTGLFVQRSDTAHPTIVKVPITGDEYFLLENRQVDVAQPDTIDVDVEDGVVIAVGYNEYDFFQFGSGMLVWHIDQKTIADYGPYNAVNIDPAHKGVDLEEGDGVQDYDVPYWLSRDYYSEIYGNKYDPFFNGGYNDRFTCETNPNSDGYTGRSFLDVALQGYSDTTQRLKDTVIPVGVGWDLYKPGFPVDPGRRAPMLSTFAADLDGDGMLELVNVDTLGQISAWRSNGQGFRYTNGGFVNMAVPTHSDVAVGDVAGDSLPEVVGTSFDGRVRVYSSAGATVATMTTGDHAFASPVLADLDGNGKKDIILGSTDGRLYAWTGTGASLPGFPVDIGTEIRAAVAVTDTVRPQTVVLTGDSRLYLVNPDGSIASGFPVTLGSSPYYATAQPLVGDFDRDANREIAVVAAGEHDYRLSLVSLDGTVRYVSPEHVRSPFTGELAAADMNGDGFPDVLTASMNELTAMNYNATLVTNYPFRQDSTFATTELAGNWIITFDTYFQYASSPVVADINGDGTSDVVIGSPQYGLLMFNGMDGRTLSFSPLMTTAGVSSVPLVADIDGDEHVELACGSDSGLFYVWAMPGAPAGVKWSCAYHDACHTGLIRAEELPPAVPRPLDPAVSDYYVWPNPAGASVHVRYRLGDAVTAVRIRLIDMSGEAVGGEAAGSAVPDIDNETTLDLSAVPPGTYVVRLAVTSGTASETKFIKLAVVR